MKQYYVYILTNSGNTVLYVGVTNNLERRLYEHKNELVDGFSKKYHIHKLLYSETYDEIIPAIEREKQLKHWQREWKLELIKSINPQFRDLSRNMA